MWGTLDECVLVKTCLRSIICESLEDVLSRSYNSIVRCDSCILHLSLKSNEWQLRAVCLVVFSIFPTIVRNYRVCDLLVIRILALCPFCEQSINFLGIDSEWNAQNTINNCVLAIGNIFSLFWSSDGLITRTCIYLSKVCEEAELCTFQACC